MQIILLVTLGTLLAGVLCWVSCEHKEYKLWNKISTHKDRMLDMALMLVLGILLIGLFYIIFSLENKAEEKALSPRQSVSAPSPRHRRILRRTPPRRFSQTRRRRIPRRY